MYSVPIIWLIIWACIPGLDISCKWFDQPMPELQPVQANRGILVLDPKRCLEASIAVQFSIINQAGGSKLVIEQVGCVAMFDGQEPGVKEHQIRNQKDQ